ncbi:hypothetical protein Tco_1269433 [Tanacetum coccineum]
MLLLYMVTDWKGKPSLGSIEVVEESYVSPYKLPLSIQLTYSCHLLLVKRMHVNNQHQPWRAIPFLINRCFTRKTSGSDKPRNPVLQILHIHRRSELPMHVTGDDFPLGNLKLVPKGEKDEVFGLHILKHLITEAIQQSPYSQQYQELVAR